MFSRSETPLRPLPKPDLRAAVASLLIPGLGQILAGKKVVGFSAMAGVVLLLWFAWPFGHAPGSSLLFFIALTVHAYTVLWPIRFARLMRRIWLQLIISIVLINLLALYYRGTAHMLASTGRHHFVRMENFRDPAFRGSRMLVVDRKPYATPARGDIVLVSSTIVPERFEHIERIIGIPGDLVEVRGGTILVNGAPSPHRPLTRIMLVDATYTVDEGHVLLLPQTVSPATSLGRLSPVHIEQIRGRAVSRVVPTLMPGRRIAPL